MLKCTLKFEGNETQQMVTAYQCPAVPPWLSWQGKSSVQSFDLDSMGSMPAIPPTQMTCFVDHYNKLE
jgi:hypothetical protein